MSTKCPYCGYLATEHQTLNNQKNPKEKDISFCIECGEISKYFEGSLIPVDIYDLDKATRKEVKRIEIAWLKTRQLIKFEKPKIIKKFRPIRKRSELSEERKKEKCYCEGCNLYPLKHFETCPNCNSKAYHTTKFAFTPVQDE